jgi:hypothetical protein
MYVNIYKQTMSNMFGKEGSRVASLIKGSKSDFFVADVDLAQDCEALKKCASNCKTTLGKVRAAFMMISSGDEKLLVLANVPQEFADRVDPQAWVEASIKDIGTNPIFEKYETSDGNSNSTRVACTVDANFPFKLKDEIRSKSFTYLRSIKALADDDESEDEYYGFDDN